MPVSTARQLTAPDASSVQARVTPPSGEIRSLNTVRGVAALMVAGYHAPMLFGAAHQLPHAYLAVDLFFVLSGFVMAHAYGRRIEDGLSLPRFAQLRLARLYPLLLLAAVAGFVVFLLKAAAGKMAFDAHALSALALNLVMMPADSSSFMPNHAAYPFVGQSWSIVWEVALCLAYFLWLRFVARGALYIALGAGVLLAVVALSRGTMDGGFTYADFWVGGVRALFAFWAGVCVRLATGDGVSPRLARILAIAAGSATTALLAYVVFVPRTIALADLGAAVVAFPLLIAACALSRTTLLENRLGDAIGAASYSVYLLHGLAIDITATGLKRLPPMPHAAAQLFGWGWMLLLLVACWFCWRHVETPLRLVFSRPLGGAGGIRIGGRVFDFAPRPA